MGPEFYQTFVSPLNNVIMWFFFFNMFIQWVIYIEFQTVIQPCIPAVNHSWSWYTIFFHRLLNLLWISPLNINMGTLFTSFLFILVVFDFGIKAMGLLKSSSISYWVRYGSLYFSSNCRMASKLSNLCV